MTITVLMASGDEDVWEGGFTPSVEGGALLIVDGEDEEDRVLVAMYAPGMWMKFEIDTSAE